MRLQPSRSVWTAGACSRFRNRPPHPERPQLPVPFLHIEPGLFSPLRLHPCPSFPLRSSRETKHRKISSYPSDPQRSSKHPSIGNSPPTVNAPPTSRSVWTAGACSRFQTRPPHPERPQLPVTFIHIEPWHFSPLRLHPYPSFPLRSSRETKHRKISSYPSDPQRSSKHPSIGNSPPTVNAPPTLAKRLDCGSLLPLSNPTASPGTSPIACTSRPYRTLAFFSAAPALCPSFPLRSSRETKYRKKRKISDNPAVERFDLVDSLRLRQIARQSLSRARGRRTGPPNRSAAPPQSENLKI